MANIAVITLIIYLVLRFGVRPYVRAAFRGGSGGGREWLVVLLGVLELAINVAAILFVSCVLALGVFALVTWHGGTAADLQRAVEHVQALEHVFTRISSTWSLAGFALLLIGLAIMTVRSSRTRWREIHAYLVERAVKQHLEGEAWEPLPPTDVMRAIECDLEIICSKLEVVREALREHVHASTSTPPALVELEQELAALNHVYLLHDATRRIADLDPDMFLPPPARTIPQKLAQVLLSRGTFGLIRGPRKWVFVAALVLVIPASMYVAGTAGVPSLREKELELEDVQLGLGERDAMTALAEAEAAAPQDASPWTDTDESALNDLADHFERATLARISDEAATTLEVTGLVSVITREAILREVAAEAPRAPRTPPRVDVPALGRSGSSAPGATRAEGPGGRAGGAAGEVAAGPEAPAKAASLEVHAVTDQIPSKGLGERFRNDLRTLARERPRLWTQIRAQAGKFRSSFRLEIGPAELRRTLLSHTLDQVVAQEVGLAADHATESAITNHRYQAQKASFLRGVVEGRGINGAYGEVAELRWRIPHVGVPDASKELARFQHLERMATEGKLEVGIDLRRAQVPRDLAASLDTMQVQRGKLGLEARSLTDAITAYEDHFAASAKWRTPRDALLESRNVLVENKASAVLRGRNYRGALSYRWTGGVVFGRTGVETGIPLDFIDLRWERRADGMSLTFVPASGEPVTFERLSPEIVRTALAFAADDRKVAVTLANVAHGLKKVMLHPVLVDTRVGCMATVLDQVVFDVLPSDEQNKLAATFQAYEAALELYKRLSEEAMKLVVERFVADAQQQLTRGELSLKGREALDTFRDMLNELRATRSARHARMQLVLDKVRAPQVLLQEEQLSPVVIQTMATCATRSPRTVQCLLEELEARIRPLMQSERSDSLFHDVQYDGASVVGEHEYRITSSLDFARHTTDNLPFFFRAQLAIDINNHQREPLILAEAQPVIDREVRSWILARQAAGDPLISDLTSFTNLQRLFRVALSGKLGAQFPIQRLATLARAIRPEISSRYLTPEWILDEIDLAEIGDQLTSDAAKLNAASASVAGRVARCADFLKPLGRQRELLVAAPRERWNAACPRELVDEAAPLAKNGNAAALSAAYQVLRLHESLELRQKLPDAPERTMYRRDRPACGR